MKSGHYPISDAICEKWISHCDRNPRLQAPPDNTRFTGARLPGDYFEARFDPEEDSLVFRRLPAKENWLEVMKTYPVSPDDLPARRRKL